MRSNRLANRIAVILFILISALFTFYLNTNELNESHNQLNRKLLSAEDKKDEESTNSQKRDNQISTNCTTPSIENFPRIPPKFRESVLMTVICSLIIIYIFIGIAIICDHYFVPSLQVICDKLKLESDVAGSTFMAAGSSAPELAASVIGVFVAKDDIGVGTVVGSAVFNIAFVISICALFAGTVIRIHWWPIVRDSFFYLISICVLFVAMFDERVTVIESIMFILVYMLYILFMAYNKQIENKVLEKCKFFARPQNDQSNDLVSYKQISESEKSSQTGSSTNVSDVESKLDHQTSKALEEHMSLNLQKSTEFETSGQIKISHKVWNITIYPLKLICRLTIPDCTIADRQKWFIITFLMSCFWISILSYFLVWMITIIGFNLRIPDTVMGLVFIAAGASVPDAIASLIVAREGLGDMALTNAIASNVFDILICLGLPWFLKTAIVDPGSSVKVTSRGLEYSTLSLLSTVAFFLILTHMNGWKLDRKYGIILMIWYFAFMVMASLYELNVFGPLNPPMCPTDF